MKHRAGLPCPQVTISFAKLYKGRNVEKLYMGLLPSSELKAGSFPKLFVKASKGELRFS